MDDDFRPLAPILAENGLRSGETDEVLSAWALDPTPEWEARRRAAESALR